MAIIAGLSNHFSTATWEMIESKFSEEAKTVIAKLIRFVEDDCIPAEAKFHSQVSEEPSARWASYPAVIEELKAKSKRLGLFNLWMSREHYAEGSCLSNLEYAVAAEIMGRCRSVSTAACDCMLICAWFIAIKVAPEGESVCASRWIGR